MPRLEALERRLNEGFEASKLPDAPSAMEPLEDFIVHARVELGSLIQV